MFTSRFAAEHWGIVNYYYALVLATQTADSAAPSISVPTIAISIAVGIVSAILTSFTQRWSVRRTLEAEERRRKEDDRATKLVALRAYEIALHDASLYLWSRELHSFSRVAYPANLNDLRIAARPHFSHVELDDPAAFKRMNAVAEDGQTAGQDADDFSTARLEVLKVIESIKEQEAHRKPRRVRTWIHGFVNSWWSRLFRKPSE